VFNNFRIVQLSDLHASFWVGQKYLEQVVEKVNKLDKDLLVITGDIITGVVNDFWKRWLPTANRDYLVMVVNVLSSLKECDKIVVLGNHDQWDGIETEKRLVRELEKRAFVILRNTSMPILRGKERIHIAGIDDVWFSYDLTKAMRNIPHDAFKILLSHSPDIMLDVREDMKIDLTITGHTHGGQVAIPFLSHHFIPIDNPSRYLMGLVEEPYGYTYVNRGIGTLVFPFRLGAPPEITCFNLSS
jgi:predicted MPP superfamily phosphohydrolase